MTTAIFWPVLALVLWTLAISLRVAWLRVSGTFKDPSDPKYYDVHNKDNAPRATVYSGENLSNLYEMPVLFYAMCIASYLTGNVDHWQVNLAWAFVGFRLVHSGIHLTYNNIPHRFAAYMLATLALAAMAVRLAMGL